MTQLKFLGIKTSGRVKGNSDIILNELVRPARDKGHNVEVICLTDYHLKHCDGCFGCNNADLRCVLKDDLEKIKEKIGAADAIALVSPCMAIGAPSILKTVLDRSAAWAFDVIAQRSKPKYGAAVLVAGATPKWFSLQRVWPSEFLQMFNCRAVGMFTIGDTGLKAEILLSPTWIERIHGLGKALVDSAESNSLQRYIFSELNDRLTCPVCLSDTFHVDNRGRYNCAVCDSLIKKYAKYEKLLKQPDENSSDSIFTPYWADYHTDFVGKKISRLMNASDEVQNRAVAYFDRGILPEKDFVFEEDEAGKAHVPLSVSWDEEGLATFEKSVPVAFKRFVKGAVEKKAMGSGISVITKEIFLKIKRESGN